MLELLPVAFQAYIFTLAAGLFVALVVFWMLFHPLRSFLKAIFDNEPVERFWMRLIFLVLVLNTFSAAVGYRPDEDIALDIVVLVWNLADQLQSIFQALLLAIFLLFLPLLLSYTILHVGRPAHTASERNSPEDR